MPNQTWLGNPTPHVDCNGHTKDWATEAIYECPFVNKKWGCLYDLIDDPCEMNDLRLSNPSKYNELLAILRDYRDAAVPPISVTSQPNLANPDNHGGYWSPW